MHGLDGCEPMSLDDELAIAFLRNIAKQEMTSFVNNTPIHVRSSSCSDQQGFGNPCGYKGKGEEGRGQGTECPTPHKPLPVSEGKGIPSLLLTGKSRDVCGHLPHHKHTINN